MKLSNEQLIDNLKLLGLVNLSTNKPIAYSGFKNRASVHKYGKNYKIVFVGQPKENLFGFYVMYDNDTKAMKESYEMFVSLVKGNMDDYDNGDVQWGNAGIPLSYGGLRQIYENKFAETEI
jgi:hypothetical protein